LDKCQELFEHGEMAKEKPDKTEQDGETQIVPKERVPKCPNSRCWEHMFYQSSTKRAC
jgi:hypothetical protein